MPLRHRDNPHERRSEQHGEAREADRDGAALGIINLWDAHPVEPRPTLSPDSVLPLFGSGSLKSVLRSCSDRK